MARPDGNSIRHSPHRATPRGPLPRRETGPLSDRDQHGPGEDGGTGVGNLSQRQQRNTLWTMIFNPRSGSTYARQLSDLGAIIAIPGPNGEQDPWYVFRNLNQRPVSGQLETVKEFAQIRWLDNKTESVTSLCQELGISPAPVTFVAFFPAELEKELYRLE
ncbi:MAG: hypothetical protein HY260_18670, partial [Chloroflexi bacterium]|nr:hypothetical protein [Chloroflexota bacterium]